MSKPTDSKALHSSKWIACPIEEQYFANTLKANKQERKIAIATDRSKQKKTDRDQKQKQKQRHQQNEIEQAEERKGRILSILPQGILVHDGEKTWLCALRGILKKEKWESKNFIAVGDLVHFIPNGEEEASIIDIEERYSVLARADNLSRRKQQLIAANIDQVLITLSVVNPELKPALADRYVIAAKKGNMTPIIIINKIDLLIDAPLQQKQYDEFTKAYRAVGIDVIGVSILMPETILLLQQTMQGKTSVFSGQSGVGKSSLINILTGLALRTGETVNKTNKGTHTTTSAQLLPLPQGGWTIDTPGIRSFGLLELTPSEIRSYFVDIAQIGTQCHYPTCLHINEPKCAVLKAVEEGSLSFIRLESYYSLLASLEDKYVRR